MRFLTVVAAIAASMLVACDGKPSSKLTTPVSYKFSVKGMHCEGCEGAICAKVTKIEGVTACKASHTAAEVEVVAPAEQRERITAAIKKLGYTVE
jgi:copper chaperone CopZ